jgi:hypothetical protein
VGACSSFSVCRVDRAWPLARLRRSYASMATVLSYLLPSIERMFAYDTRRSFPRWFLALSLLRPRSSASIQPPHSAVARGEASWC